MVARIVARQLAQRERAGDGAESEAGKEHPVAVRADVQLLVGHGGQEALHGRSQQREHE